MAEKVNGTKTLRYKLSFFFTGALVSLFGLASGSDDYFLEDEDGRRPATKPSFVRGCRLSSSVPPSLFFPSPSAAAPVAVASSSSRPSSAMSCRAMRLLGRFEDPENGAEETRVRETAKERDNGLIFPFG